MPEAKMGENLSALTQASARGLAKFGRFMTHKGTFEEHSIMSREAWEDMHSDPILSAELGPVFSNYTKGGI